MSVSHDFREGGEAAAERSTPLSILHLMVGLPGSGKTTRPEVLDQRRSSVEHPFGTIKQWMNQGAFLMPRLENVRGESSLTALAYNIGRVISLVGGPSLIAAAKA